MDALACVLRRCCTKQNIFAPHKLHLYQRLSQKGLSHSQVSLIYILTTIFLFIINQSYGLSGLFFGFVITIIIGIYLDLVVALPFNKSQNNF